MSCEFYITPEEYEQASKHGVCRKTLNARVRDLGWKKQAAIHTPVQKHRQVESKWVRIAGQNGISYTTFMARVNTYGWDEERAATQPLQDKRAAAALATEKTRVIPKEYGELAAKNGISYSTFRKRIQCGWDMDKAATHPVMTGKEKGQLAASTIRKRYGDINALIFMAR